MRRVDFVGPPTTLDRISDVRGDEIGVPEAARFGAGWGTCSTGPNPRDPTTMGLRRPDWPVGPDQPAAQKA